MGKNVTCSREKRHVAPETTKPGWRFPYNFFLMCTYSKVNCIKRSAMKPIFIILYAVIVTLLLSIFMPRLRKAPSKFLWALMITGLVALIIVVVLVIGR